MTPLLCWMNQRSSIIVPYLGMGQWFDFPTFFVVCGMSTSLVTNSSATSYMHRTVLPLMSTPSCSSLTWWISSSLSSVSGPLEWVLFTWLQWNSLCVRGHSWPTTYSYTCAGKGLSNLSNLSKQFRYCITHCYVTTYMLFRLNHQNTIFRSSVLGHRTL